MSDAGPVGLVATLTVAGLGAGVALVLAYELTLPRIEANKAAALEKAVVEVLPGSVRTQKLVWDGSALQPGEGGPVSGEEAIWAAYGPDDKLVGYAIPGEGPGFQDTIRLIFGFDPGSRNVVGMQILDSRETPGLGDKIYKDPAFAENFLKLAVEPPIKAVAKGTKAQPNEVDAITGATISSKAVVRIMNGAGQTWFVRLPDASPPPAAPAADSPGSTP